MYQDILNEDGTVTRWQGGAATTYANAQEAAMAGDLSAIQEFQAAYDKARPMAQQFLALCDEIESIRDANPDSIAVSLADLAADQTAIVGDSTLNRSQLYTALLLFDAIQAFKKQTLGATGLTVKQALYRR
jgi:hypothetical protein